MSVLLGNLSMLCCLPSSSSSASFPSFISQMEYWLLEASHYLSLRPGSNQLACVFTEPLLFLGSVKNVTEVVCWTLDVPKKKNFICGSEGNHLIYSRVCFFPFLRGGNQGPVHRGDALLEHAAVGSTAFISAELDRVVKKLKQHHIWRKRNPKREKLK